MAGHSCTHATLRTCDFRCKGEPPGVDDLAGLLFGCALRLSPADAAAMAHACRGSVTMGAAQCTGMYVTENFVNSVHTDGSDSSEARSFIFWAHNGDAFQKLLRQGADGSIDTGEYIW